MSKYKLCDQSVALFESLSTSIFNNFLQNFVAILCYLFYFIFRDIAARIQDHDRGTHLFYCWARPQSCYPCILFFRACVILNAHAFFSLKVYIQNDFPKHKLFCKVKCWWRNEKRVLFLQVKPGHLLVIPPISVGAVLNIDQSLDQSLNLWNILLWNITASLSQGSWVCIPFIFIDF